MSNGAARENLPAPSSEQSWWLPCAELMAREAISLREATSRMRVEITNEDIARTLRLRGFQRLLEQSQNKLYMEIALNPSWSKRTAVGKMLFLVDRLVEKGEHDKALEGLLKVARVEGWLNPDVAVNITQSLTDDQIAELKSRAAERLVREGTSLPS